MYRAVDQHGQVIDVLVTPRRNAEAARRFFHRALTTLKVRPTEVVTDAAPVYPRVLSGLAFLQKGRRGHYELATEATRSLRVATAFAELAHAI